MTDQAHTPHNDHDDVNHDDRDDDTGDDAAGEGVLRLSAGSQTAGCLPGITVVPDEFQLLASGKSALPSWQEIFSRDPQPIWAWVGDAKTPDWPGTPPGWDGQVADEAPGVISGKGDGMRELFGRRCEPPPPEVDGEDEEDGMSVVRALSEGTDLALHLASAHGDEGAFYRPAPENQAIHLAFPLHRHTRVQESYEAALNAKIESDAEHEGRTVIGWQPVPHPEPGVADLGRIIGRAHEENRALSPALLAADLAWIKISPWPWHRRLLAALLIAFAPSLPPSWRLDPKSREAVRRLPGVP